MTNKTIIRPVRTLFEDINGLVGVWLYILLLSDKSRSALTSGFIISIVVIIFKTVKWCKRIVFEEKRVVFVKLFSEEVFNKSEISNVLVIKDAYFEFEYNDTTMKMYLIGMKKNDISYIKEYFNIV